MADQDLPRMGWAEERRATLRALAVLFLIGVVVAAFCFRPATVLGVDGSALARSVSGLPQGECEEAGDDLWQCRAFAGSDGVFTYSVETRSFGCWDAWRGSRDERAGEGFSGCITVFDLL